jgi:hypothetical protein
MLGWTIFGIQLWSFAAFIFHCNSSSFQNSCGQERELRWLGFSISSSFDAPDRQPVPATGTAGCSDV